MGLAVPVQLVPVAAAAGPASMDTFYDKLAAAEEAEGAGEPVRAGTLYDEAYAAMPEAERASETGSDIVKARVRVGREAFFATPDDPVPLEASSALLAQHLADVKRLKPSRNVDELTKLQSSTDALLARFRADSGDGTEEDTQETADDQGGATEAEDPEPDTPPPNPDPYVDNPPRKDRRALGVGLTVGGGALLVGGVVLLAVGGNLFSATTTTYNANKDLYPQDCTVDGSVCDFADWRDGEYDRGRVFVGVGAAAGVIGLGLTIAGVVILVKSRRSGTAALGPMQLRGGGGLSLRGAF